MNVHETYTLKREGALWYVVVDGDRVSPGFHEITVQGNGRFRGKKGARTRDFTVNTDE